MTTKKKKYGYPVFFVFFYALPIAWISFKDNSLVSAEIPKTKDTRISGKLSAADGGPLSGVIVIEKGRLYNKQYKYGGRVDEKGQFFVTVPEGGDYGLHLYATGYIYHPVGVEVQGGRNNTFMVTMPPNPAGKEAPVISEVRFEQSAENKRKMVIKLSVNDPNQNLSHQILGVNVRTQEGFIFSPPKFVLPWTRNYPDGIYTLVYDTEGKVFDSKEWLFVAADNRCYNSPVLQHPFTEEDAVQAHMSGEPKPIPLETPSPLPELPNNRQAIERGLQVFTDNCAVCHYPDKKRTKVGPGLKGLFKKRLTPARNVPVTVENIQFQIHNGSENMPPYSHVQGQKLSFLLAYLKSL